MQDPKAIPLAEKIIGTFFWCTTRNDRKSL